MAHMTASASTDHTQSEENLRRDLELLNLDDWIVLTMQPEEEGNECNLVCHHDISLFLIRFPVGTGPQQAQQRTLQQEMDNHVANMDPGSLMLIRLQLVLMLHAHTCPLPEQQNRTEGLRQCRVPCCRYMKRVLNHINSCAVGRLCVVPNCISSRYIIFHWKNCYRHDCPLCGSLKILPDQRPEQRQPAAPGTQSLEQVRRDLESLSLDEWIELTMQQEEAGNEY